MVSQNFFTANPVYYEVPFVIKTVEKKKQNARNNLHVGQLTKRVD